MIKLNNKCARKGCDREREDNSIFCKEDRHYWKKLGSGKMAKKVECSKCGSKRVKETLNKWKGTKLQCLDCGKRM